MQFNNLNLNKRNEKKHMKTITNIIYPAFALFAFACCGGIAFAQQDCSTSKLAPYGLAPAAGGHCAGTGCLVKFNNYQWWTAFTFNPQKGYYYNGGLGTTFAPEHVVVDRQGDMHLRMAKDWNNNNKLEWAGAEAVLMFRADGTTQANLGYGDYLVTAQIVKPVNATFATYDPNVALGIFTYERPDTGSSNNPAREIDLAEISRWGWNHVTPAACPFSGFLRAFDKSTLCQGNAQFALQDYTQHTGMVKRYDIGLTNQITMVMRWRQGVVTFEKYNGIHTLERLPPQADFSWTTPPELSEFVPTPEGCARFHINLWLGNYYDPNWHPLCENCPHAGPTDGQEVEVVIRNFEFRQP
jgi:hypothetical protein